jgi:hypothetical protein
MRRRRARVAWAVSAPTLALALGAAACSLLVGVDDLHFAPDAASDAPSTPRDAPVDRGASDRRSEGRPGEPDAVPDTAPDACMFSATLCPGTCVTDLKTSAQSCGRCGHDCEGGACKNGVCQPFTLVTMTGLAGLAADAAHVYFTAAPEKVTNSGVYAVPVAGGKVVTLVTGQDNAGAVVVDSSHVYWTNAGMYAVGNGSVVRARLDGSEVTTLATSQKVPTDLVLGTSEVYWTNHGGGSLGHTASDGSGGARAQLIGTTGTPAQLVLVSNRIYWTDDANNCIGFVSLATLSPTQLICSQTFPSGIVAAGSVLYWTDRGLGDAGSVVSYATGVDSGASLTLASGGSPQYLAVDPQNVYWTAGAGNVLEQALDGGARVTLASEQIVPGAIVAWPPGADAKALYWIDLGKSELMKLVR